MALLLDSSVLIEAERRDYPLSRIVEVAADDEALAISAITVSEILLGIYLAKPSPRRDLRQDFVERIIDRFEVLSLDLPVARLYARLWSDLRRAGNIIAPHDLLIGSTALFNGYDVLTHNLRDFHRIPGLKIRQPGW